jgi:hypothetical protein
MFSLKDSLITTVIKPFINSYISDLGEVSDLSLSSKNNQMTFTVVLVGESSPIEVKILDYAIEKEENNSYLVIKDMIFSREWINIALKKWKPELKFPVPSLARHFL